MSNYLEEALAKINNIPKQDSERVEKLENELCELRETLNALIEKIAA